MPLKASQELFKFPIRMYDPVELDEEEYLQELSNQAPQRFQRDYVVGVKALFIESITEYNSGFARGRDLDEVRRNGMDMTIVTVGQDSYVCDWDIKTFEKEYDRHYKKLMKNHKEIEEDEFLEEFLTEEIAKELQTKK